MSERLRMTEATFQNHWDETCKECLTWVLTMDDKGKLSENKAGGLITKQNVRG